MRCQAVNAKCTEETLNSTEPAFAVKLGLYVEPPAPAIVSRHSSRPFSPEVMRLVRFSGP